MHNYGLVLDQTVRSGPAFSQTGPDRGQSSNSKFDLR